MHSNYYKVITTFINQLCTPKAARWKPFKDNKSEVQSLANVRKLQQAEYNIVKGYIMFFCRKLALSCGDNKSNFW